MAPIRRMPRAPVLASSDGGLAERLADEIKSGKEYGQPLVYEQEYVTKKIRTTVVWDVWADRSLEDRSSIILRACELAQGSEARDRIALASGLTVPEAAAAGLLPYEVVPGIRKSDDVDRAAVRNAMLEEGASTLHDVEGSIRLDVSDDRLLLRFATEEEARACVARLVQRIPSSEEIWMIGRQL